MVLVTLNLFQGIFVPQAIAYGLGTNYAETS
jgi:hypothetical protein